MHPFTAAKAEEYLAWAAGLNPGPWEAHSRAVAGAAATIAAACGLDPDRARALGLIHDIGRYKPGTGLRHVYDGYALMRREGFPEAARICLTHSFPVRGIGVYNGNIDCSPEERDELAARLAEAEADDYDGLVQLCDSLALPTGVCLMEKRLVDVAMRHGVNEFLVPKWRALFGLLDDFSKRAGQSLYALFPEAVDNTFAD